MDEQLESIIHSLNEHGFGEEKGTLLLNSGSRLISPNVVFADHDDDDQPEYSVVMITNCTWLLPNPRGVWRVLQPTTVLLVTGTGQFESVHIVLPNGTVVYDGLMNFGS
jgi:hypothetical protein